jgi:hypothetical protein
MDRLPSAQHHTECKCPQCWSLAEYMTAMTGKDYGLPRAPGCPHKHPASNVVPLRRPDPEPSAPKQPHTTSQPWQPRAPRFAARQLRQAA